LARYLLQLRADPDARDDTHQRTPLDWAEHEGHVEAAEMLRRQTRSRLLGRLSTRRKTFQQERSSLPVQQGQAVPAPRRKSEAAPRRRSRRKSVMPESYIPVLEEIDRRGWNNMQWTNGFTLLHWAAQNDQPDLVEQLFTKAADPLQKDDAGRTALDFARESGSLAVVEALKRYSPPAPEVMDLSEHGGKDARRRTYGSVLSSAGNEDFLVENPIEARRQREAFQRQMTDMMLNARRERSRNDVPRISITGDDMDKE